MAEVKAGILFRVVFVKNMAVFKVNFNLDDDLASEKYVMIDREVVVRGYTKKYRNVTPVIHKVLGRGAPMVHPHFTSVNYQSQLKTNLFYFHPSQSERPKTRILIPNTL